MSGVGRMRYASWLVKGCTGIACEIPLTLFLSLSFSLSHSLSLSLSLSLARSGSFNRLMD